MPPRPIRPTTPITPAKAGGAGDDALPPGMLAVIEALALADARRDYAAALENRNRDSQSHRP